MKLTALPLSLFSLPLSVFLRFATGTNQNCGNFMTGRSSTRLHAPPGGSSKAGSLIFGGGADTGDRFSGRGRSANPAQSNTYTQHQATQQQPSFANKEQYNYQSNTQQQSSAPVAAVKATTATTATTATHGTSANAFASGTNQNCGNFITDRPTSRVLAPPGGRSSGPLW